MWMNLVPCAIRREVRFSWVQVGYFALKYIADFLKKAKFIFNLERIATQLGKFHKFCIKKKQLELFSVK